jgi:hypothetical protein
MVVEAGLARLRMANDDRCKHLSLPPDYRRSAAAWACLPESALFSSHLSDRLCVQTFIKFDIFGSFLRISGSAGAGKGVLLYREGNSCVWNKRTSRVWNKREPGAIRGHWWRLRRAKRVGEGGLAGARVRRRLSRRVFLLGFFLVGGRAWLRVDSCGLLPATPGGGIDLRVDRRRG